MNFVCKGYISIKPTMHAFLLNSMFYQEISIISKLCPINVESLILKGRCWCDTGFTQEVDNRYQPRRLSQTVHRGAVG